MITALEPLRRRLPTPAGDLRRCRILVRTAKGTRVVPIVVVEPTDALALGRAMRQGARFYGRDFIGAETAEGLHLRKDRAA